MPHSEMIQYQQMSKKEKFQQLGVYFQLFHFDTPGKVAYFVKTYGKMIMAFIDARKGRLPAEIVGEIFSNLIAKTDNNGTIQMQSLARVPRKILTSRTVTRHKRILTIQKIIPSCGHRHCYSDESTNVIKKVTINRRYALVPEKQLARKIQRLTKFIVRRFELHTSYAIEQNEKLEQQWNDRNQDDVHRHFSEANGDIKRQRRLLNDDLHCIQSRIYHWKHKIEHYDTVILRNRYNVLFIEAKVCRLLDEDRMVAETYYRCSRYYYNLFKENIRVKKNDVDNMKFNIRFYDNELDELKIRVKKLSDEIQRKERQVYRNAYRKEHRKNKKEMKLLAMKEQSKIDSLAYVESLSKSKVYRKNGQ